VEMGLEMVIKHIFLKCPLKNLFPLTYYGLEIITFTFNF
jgi:hypothetical protein